MSRFESGELEATAAVKASPSGSQDAVRVEVLPEVVVRPQPTSPTYQRRELRAQRKPSGPSFWELLWRPSSPDTLEAIQSGFAAGYQSSGGAASLPVYEGMQTLSPAVIGSSNFSLPQISLQAPKPKQYQLPSVGLSSRGRGGGGGLPGGKLLPIVGGIAILGGLILYVRKKKRQSP